MTKNIEFENIQRSHDDDVAEMYKISYKFDEKNGIFWIYCLFDNNLELRFSQDVYRMMKKYKGRKKKFHINLSSYGGSIDSGLAMYDMMEKSGFTFDCYVNGSCYSMASFFLSACNGTRKMSKYSKYGQHGNYYYNDEKITMERLKSDMEIFKIDIEILDSILINRSNGKLTQEKLYKLSKAEMKYFTANQALEYGLIDEVC